MYSNDLINGLAKLLKKILTQIRVKTDFRNRFIETNKSKNFCLFWFSFRINILRSKFFSFNFLFNFKESSISDSNVETIIRKLYSSRTQNNYEERISFYFRNNYFDAVFCILNHFYESENYLFSINELNIYVNQLIDLL